MSVSAACDSKHWPRSTSVHPAKIRTVVYDERFEYEPAYLQPNVRKADDFVDGAVNILARDPEAGCQLEDSEVWFVCGHTVDAALYYTFDKDHVYFLSIEKTKLPEL
jgi:hypothetical protein